MFRRARPLTLRACALLAALGAAPVSAQSERQAAEALVLSARAERDAAAEALTALIEELADDYVALTSGPQAATHRHAIVLAVLDSLDTARARLAAEAGRGRAVLRGTRRQILLDAFDLPVRHSGPLDPRLAAWVARRMAEELSARESFDGLGADQLLAVLDRLFPAGLTWYEFWNETFHYNLEEAERWTRAQLAYEAAGLALDRLLQPERYGAKGEVAPPGMVIVPGGNYNLGPGTGWQRPERRVTLKPFAIDRREVTQGEYALYVNALPPAARQAALPRGWRLDGAGLAELDPARRDHPVIFVSWSQAAGYAAWAGKRLPTEDEWEAAAAGTAGFIFPWGNTWREDLVALGDAEAGTLPVEAFPEGRSPAGCFDMAGNAWEWTATLEDGRDIKELPEGLVNVMIRGGGYDSQRVEVSTRYRRGALGHDTFAAARYKVPIGFRCVKDL